MIPVVRRYHRIMVKTLLTCVLVVASAGACKKSSEAGEPAKKIEPKDTTPAPPPAVASPEPAKPADPAPVPTAPEPPAGNPPPDGKYERVQVEGVTVPMINVMENGTIVLVDTDGKKPRTWEQRYKKKAAKLAGQFDLHWTDGNNDGKFVDGELDKQGLWVIDAKGNITRH